MTPDDPGVTSGEHSNSQFGNPDPAVAARFYRVLQSLQPRMLAYAAKMLPARTRASIDSQDAVQDACEKAVRRLHTLEWKTEASAERWIMTILRNTLIDLMRGHHKLTPRPLHELMDDDLEVALAELVVYERTPSKSALDRERAQQLQKALNGLAEPYRATIRMRYVEQVSAADLSIETGRTTDAIKKICQRGILMLRETLGADQSRGN